MADLTKLTGDSIQLPSGEVFEAVINEDASAVRQEVKCVIPSIDPLMSTDPMGWMPFVTADGIYYPKRGDRAKVSDNGDGPGAVLVWWPTATEPDVSF